MTLLVIQGLVQSEMLRRLYPMNEAGASDLARDALRIVDAMMEQTK